jgi:hypothetical protein
MASAYKHRDDGSVIRVADGATIPPDPANSDYAEFLVWQEAGGESDPEFPPPTLDQRRAAVIAAIGARAAEAIAAGAPYVSRDASVTGRLDVDEASTGRIAAMATFAGFSKDGVAAWGPPYTFWILADNSEAPLGTWQDGLALAIQAGGYVGAVILHARALKNSVLASADPESLDIEAGWPG